jgi:hypothetical protein
MSTATLSEVPATQLTFPWAMPKADCEPVIVADRSLPTESPRHSPRPAQEAAAQSVARYRSSSDSTLAEALDGDRIGRPFRVGSVMFRLLKSYGISDEEIADGIAQYAAKKHSARN